MKDQGKITCLVLSALLLSTTVFSMTSCAADGNAQGETDKFFTSMKIAQADGAAYTPTIVGSPTKTEVPLLTGDVYEVAAKYERYITDKYNLTYGDCFAPTPLTLSWECAENALYYTVDISTSKNLSDAQSYITFQSSVTLPNLYMGYDYYYQVSAKYEDRLVKSRIFEFETAYLPRTVLVDENISNTRDWGGYFTADGKRVKQGIVYRGGALENITPAGKDVMLNELGIKTDLDVRKDGSTNAGVSPLGAGVKYLEAKGPYYVGRYGDGIDLALVNGTQKEKEYRAGLLTEIRAFANADNFPIYVHCSLGRDRTGTLCFLIQALLGVSEFDIYRDYEMSMMSRLGKTDSQKASYMVKEPFTKLYNYIKDGEFSQTPQTGNTLQDNAEAFMLSIGVTKGEIESIKANMLEGGN